MGLFFTQNQNKYILDEANKACFRTIEMFCMEIQIEYNWPKKAARLLAVSGAKKHYNGTFEENYEKFLKQKK